MWKSHRQWPIKCCLRRFNSVVLRTRGKGNAALSPEPCYGAARSCLVQKMQELRVQQGAADCGCRRCNVLWCSGCTSPAVGIKRREGNKGRARPQLFEPVISGISYQTQQPSVDHGQWQWVRLMSEKTHFCECLCNSHLMGAEITRDHKPPPA